MSSVTESLLSLGEFTLRFKRDTPRSVLAAVTHWDHVVVTPTRPIDASLSRATLLSIARFTGRIDEITFEPDRRVVRGPSCLAWLGDHDEKGSFQAPTFSPIALTLATLLVAVFSNAGYVNGLTLGNTAGLSANTIYDSLFANETVRTALERWRLLTTAQTEYRAAPDGSVGFAPYGGSQLFKTTPTVVVSREAGSITGSVVGWHAPKLTYTKDVRRMALEVACEGNGVTGNASTIFTRPKCFDGSTDAAIAKKITSPSANATDVGNAALNALVNVYTPQWRFSAEVDVYDPGAYAIPGDAIYLFDEDLELVDVSNPVQLFGRIIYPAKVRLYGYTWPILPGMGVYLLHTADGTNTVQDVTRYVDFGDGDTTLEIGTAPLTLTGVIDSTRDRSQ